MIEPVLVGFSDYMVLATLEKHSEHTRRLLGLCQRAVERRAGALSTTRDIVHLDFTYHNILCAEDLVTGVIDWGGTSSGDRLSIWPRFDSGLDTLAAWQHPIRCD